jgi:plastocyanin
MRVLPRALVAALTAATALVTCAATASAEEKLLTLYSPAIETQPYVHDSKTITLRPDGRQAPDRPGYVTGVQEQVLVDSLDPDAKPLNNAQFMIHHFVTFAPGRVEERLGGCWNGLGYVMGRGEEHPSGQFGHYAPPDRRAHYGIPNMTPSGAAPAWRLLAMVMNHVKRPKRVYVRTKLWYTEEPREPITPVVVGDCSHMLNGMSYDVPGGGPKGSKLVHRSSYRVPDGFRGRILLAASHQHGGADYQLLSSRTCEREIFPRARAYYGTKDHIYMRIRPILHEPGPIANGTFGTRQGVPVTGGEIIDNRAVHDNHNLHVAAMGFWALHLVRDETAEPCGPMPTDIAELNRPRRFAAKQPHGLVVPQLARAIGPVRPFRATSPLRVGDEWFRPMRVRARVGQTLRWRFDGALPHTVTVANGPRGFSSYYAGQTRGEYAFTPTVKGTYRLTCLVHPTTMGQTVDVR